MRTFTPRTARVALETIRPAASLLLRLMSALERVKPPKIESDTAVDRSYFILLRELISTMEVLHAEGVQVKDPRAGLIDFPARRAGRVVLLCWKVGEPSLEFWHEIEAGFAGRRRVDEEGPWEEERGGSEMSRG